MRTQKQISSKQNFETLEARRMMSAALTDMAALAAQQYPTGTSHATTLYVNFDGGTINNQQAGGQSTIAPFKAIAGDNQEADIQDILNRVSEVFAPFDVSVKRISGAGKFDAGNGSTTILVGANSVNVNSSGKKVAADWTPTASLDYPNKSNNYAHKINSDSYDFAFVDPVSKSGGQNVTVENDQQIAQGIAHEAGHTFGLANVLASTKDVMSDSSTNAFFSNQTLNITDELVNIQTGSLGHSATTAPIASESVSVGSSIVSSPVAISTQNAYAVLSKVLTPNNVIYTGPSHMPADSWTQDPKWFSQQNPYDAPCFGGTFTDKVGNGFSDSMPITNTSDKTVYYKAALSQVTTLDPEILVYDSAGQTLLYATHGKTATLALAANQSYQLVIGAFEGNSVGSYTLTMTSASQSGSSALGDYNHPLTKGGGMVGFSTLAAELLS